MNPKNIIFLILFLLLITIILSTIVSFDSDGEGYTIEDNILTITGEGEYDFSGEEEDKEILVESSCTLYFNGFTLINSNNLTPLLISSGKQVNLILTG